MNSVHEERLGVPIISLSSLEKVEGIYQTNDYEGSWINVML